MDYNEKKTYRKGLLTGLIIALTIACILMTAILLFVYRSSEVLTPRAKAKVAALSNYIQDNYIDDIDVGHV